MSTYLALKLAHLLSGAVLFGTGLGIVFLQYRMARHARDARSYEALPAVYHRGFRIWCALGVPAFGAVLALYALMVFKPGLG